MTVRYESEWVSDNRRNMQSIPRVEQDAWHKFLVECVEWHPGAAVTVCERPGRWGRVGRPPETSGGAKEETSLQN